MPKRKNINRKIQPREKSAATPVARSESFYSKTPSWCFSRADTGGKWPLCSLEPNVLQHLRGLEGKTWQEILVTNKKQNHLIKFENMIKDAQDRVLQCQYDRFANDGFYSLRIDGTHRLWGIIQDGVYYIIWDDPCHEVCPSNLKHT